MHETTKFDPVTSTYLHEMNEPLKKFRPGEIEENSGRTEQVAIRIRDLMRNGAVFGPENYN